MKRFLSVMTTVCVLLSGCFAFAAQTGNAQAKSAKGFVYTPAQAEQIISARARGVITALRDRHMNRLASFVDPARGLQFSPYVSAGDSDRVFSRSQVRRLGQTNRRYLWGEFDGTGDPIRLTWREYYFRFVYPRNFAAVQNISYNILRQRSNNINTLHDHYPGSIVVEYYTPDPQGADGLNWQGLWLVFQPHGHTWYLSGIAHDQWTI